VLNDFLQLVRRDGAGGDEFGGRSAAVAVARVISTVVVAKSQIDTPLLEGGVVDEEGIKDLTSSTQIAATTLG
jgi:hypothetical protein